MARPPSFHDPAAVLSALPHWCQHRAVVLAAVAPAQRLMDWHDERPLTEQRSYSATWRPVLASIWSYAAGDDQSWYPISHALGEYYLSPFSHVEGQDGPDDADQDEVAASIFAGNAVLHGLPGFAELASGRVLDAIDNRWFGVDDGRRNLEKQQELQRQRWTLQAISKASGDRAAWRQGAPADLIAAIRSRTE